MYSLFLVVQSLLEGVQGDFMAGRDGVVWSDFAGLRSMKDLPVREGY